ncbi:MAG TPA: hypothetical protein PK457_10715 [Methylotenera sp.]|nr:hypothetical protein [Methylotenera sp.]
MKVYQAVSSNMLAGIRPNLSRYRASISSPKTLTVALAAHLLAPQFSLIKHF